MKNQLKIVAISDTHSSTKQLENLIQRNVKGDIFIHAGDFTRYGREEHFLNFIQCLDKLQFTHKIVIAGNHDISLDANFPPYKKNKMLSKYPCSLSREVIVKELKARAHYLEHDLIEIEGIKIFGSPYTIKHARGAFQYKIYEDEAIWSSIPQNIDILITHSPPFGILDKIEKGPNVGSPALLQAVQKIKPKIHIFGHIHQSHGKENHFGVMFMNVAKSYQIIRWSQQ